MTRPLQEIIDLLGKIDMPEPIAKRLVTAIDEYKTLRNYRSQSPGFKNLLAGLEDVAVLSIRAED